jgi:hypothetical protein
MLKRFLFLLLFVIGVVDLCAQKSMKRGLAYGHHVPADFQALSKGVSWWYNWYHQPEASVFNVYEQYDLDYVPMAWTSNFDKTAMRNFLLDHPNVKYILGWNEPNFADQANLTPSQAAAHWPDIEALADEFDLKIVGPAVNYCGNCVSENDVTYGDPVKYLDDFFAACPDCRVDYIAIHSYMGNVSALQWYIGLFKKYGKPIWLTEFANWEDSPTLQQQKDFLVGAVDYLENDADVFRYAWFTGRFTGAPYIGILDSGPGALTELGNIYVNMPLHDAEIYHTIPARIEAENYNSMDGILIQMTEDANGFANVGYIDSGDWMDYGIDVPMDGTYYLYARIASTKQSSAKLLVNDVEIETLNIDNTGDWQNWKTIMIPVTLEAGQQHFKLKAVTSGFNINWIQFSSDIIMAIQDDKDVSIMYPNPIIDKLYLNTPDVFAHVEITDIYGRSLYNEPPSPTIDVSKLSSGSYIVRLAGKDGKLVTTKILKE